MSERKKIDNRKDLLLLLLYSPGVKSELNESIKGKTRLMKMVYLFSKEGLRHFQRAHNVNELNFYDFVPWNFGPFSKEVYDDLTFFNLRGFILFNEVPCDDALISSQEESFYDQNSGADFMEEENKAYFDTEIRLTEKGVNFTKPLFDSLSDSQKSILKVFKSKFQSASLTSILRYVYTTYPESTINSIIKDDILG
jgi:uncharacterized protein YwgA